jgi:hypothetical protein
MIRRRTHRRIANITGAVMDKDNGREPGKGKADSSIVPTLPGLHRRYRASDRLRGARGSELAAAENVQRSTLNVQHRMQKGAEIESLTSMHHSLLRPAVAGLRSPGAAYDIASDRSRRSGTETRAFLHVVLRHFRVRALGRILVFVRRVNACALNIIKGDCVRERGQVVRAHLRGRFETGSEPD